MMTEEAGFISSGVTPEVSRAIRALGLSATRFEILWLLLETDELSTTELMVRLAFTRNGVRHNLRALADEGLVTERSQTHPRGAGHITYWRADLDEVLFLVHGLSEVLSRAGRSR